MHSLSQIPGYSVDGDGVLSKLDVDNGVPNPHTGLYASSKYSSVVRKIINKTIPPLGEQVTAKLLGGKIIADTESRDYDVLLSDNTQVEVKTGRVGSTTTIRQGQLENLDNNALYGLVYYETKNNRQSSPAYFVQKCLEENMKLSPGEYLKRMISIKTIIIIRKPSMVHFFNTSPIRLLYNTSGMPYKALARSRALKLFEENPDNLTQQKGQFEFGRHNIDIYSLGRELHL